MKKFLIAVLLGLTLLMGTALGEMRIGDSLPVILCEEYITLREEPLTSAAELDRVPLNDRVNFIDVAENGFYRVSYQGQTGFVLSQYLGEDELPDGEPLEVTDEQRGAINLFLSNFSEQGFCWPAGNYADWNAQDQVMVDFAIDWHWFNKYQECIEFGEYFNDNNTRLAQKYLPDICIRYLGFEPNDYTQTEMDYADGYYYWMETGGHTSDGFVSLTEVRDLGGNAYAVYFTIPYSGSDYGREVYDLTAEEVQQLYPTDDPAIGKAIICTGEDGLDQREGWYLSEWTAAYRSW